MGQRDELTARLAVRDLEVRFTGQPGPTLSGVDLALADGTFTVVVGPSGCGKSTLLNCMAGLQAPSAGRRFDAGQPVTGPDPRRGVVFQRDVLFPWMDIEANLNFALRAEGVPRPARPARVVELLEAVRLSDDVRHRRPYELSGGMRQRVGIARMLAGRPQVMLMDEPFGALDAQTRLLMQDLITEICREQRATVLFVTHDVDEAIRLADRIIVLSAGGNVRADIHNTVVRPRPADRLAELDGYAELRRRLHHELFDPTAPAASAAA